MGPYSCECPESFVGVLNAARAKRSAFTANASASSGGQTTFIATWSRRNNAPSAPHDQDSKSRLHHSSSRAWPTGSIPIAYHLCARQQQLKRCGTNRRFPGRPTDVTLTASNRYRSRDGSTCRIVARARPAASPMSTQRGSRAQSDRNRERLIVVEQQRRHLGARVEAVSAVGAHRSSRSDSPSRKRSTSRRTVRSLTSSRQANTESVRFPPRLQERHQSEKSRRRGHAFDGGLGLGQKPTYTGGNVISRADPGPFFEQ